MRVVAVAPERQLVEVVALPQPEGSLSEGPRRIYAIIEDELVRGPYPEHSAWSMDEWTEKESEVPQTHRVELAAMAVAVVQSETAPA